MSSFEINTSPSKVIGNKFIAGLGAFQKGELEEAKLALEDLLLIDPKHFDALHLYGIVLGQLQLTKESIKSLQQAFEINPNNALLNCNLGSFLKNDKQYELAIIHFNMAIKLIPNYADAYYNRGNALQELNHLDESVSSYDMAIKFKRDYFKAYSNRGVVLQELKRFDEALLSLEKAIEFKGDFADAYYNRGNVLKELQHLNLRNNALDDALLSFVKAIEFKPDFAEAYYNLGNVLKELKRFDQALLCYEKALVLKPNYEYLLGSYLNAKMLICDWGFFDINVAELTSRINEGGNVSLSFYLLALADNLPLILKSTASWIKNNRPLNTVLGPLSKSKRKEKIKIGYYSSDFKEHAVSYLTAELFELHDENKFELVGFYSGPKDYSAIQDRVSNAFHKFFYITLKSDKEVAEFSRKIGIDIAVDLSGLTGDARVPGIFSYRAAPIQLSYIGYLGTMGAEYYDYLIADKTIIPPKNQQYYSEKIVYLPNFQVNDSKREIASKRFTRAELNLPENGFVFCCFNNNYKISPPTFDSWIRILTAAPNSVLFLYAENKWAETNLRLEAEKRGCNQTQLVFGGRIDRNEYLARYRVANLFLDTLPYNAGTTASDALWTGLPVLTCMGESFASRVAASLLNAIELPELITTTQEQYEATAIDLATNPAKLKAIKDKLAHNRLTTALFDTPLFTKHIEVAYIQMHERYQSDLSPDHIYIEA